MASPPRLASALKRFSAALDQVEAAAERLGRVGADKRDLEDTLALMQDDRGRLADDLDAALGRADILQRATDDVALRLAATGTILRRLLTINEGER